MFKQLLGSIGLFSFAISVYGAEIVVPNELENVEGDNNNVFPFAIFPDYAISARYQQIYEANDFSSLTGPELVTHIAFRPDGEIAAGFAATLPNVQINLSTTSVAVDALSNIFAENIGPDETVVYTGALSLSTNWIGPVGGPKEFDIVITLQTPFLYDPTLGNLLLDVRNFETVGTQETILIYDSHFQGGAPNDAVSRAYSLASDGVFSLSGGLDTSGLVTKFLTATSVSDCDAIVVSSYDGETMIVTNNIYTENDGACVVVVHNDVTVDCQGYRVTSANGPNGGWASVYAYGDNVTVQNCELNNWNTGVYFVGATGGRAMNNKSFQNDIGIAVSYSTGIEVFENTLKENTRSGIQVFQSANIDVYGNTVKGTGFTDFPGLTFAGITLIGSQDCYIVNNVTSQNKTDGIRLFNEADYNYVLGNTTNKNGRDGIAVLDSANGNMVNDNVANRNSRYGIGNFDSNSFYNNVCRNNDTADSFPDGNCK